MDNIEKHVSSALRTKGRSNTIFLEEGKEKYSRQKNQQAQKHRSTQTYLVGEDVKQGERNFGVVQCAQSTGVIGQIEERFLAGL